MVVLNGGGALVRLKLEKVRRPGTTANERPAVVLRQHLRPERAHRECCSAPSCTVTNPMKSSSYRVHYFPSTPPPNPSSKMNSKIVIPKHLHPPHETNYVLRHGLPRARRPALLERKSGLPFLPRMVRPMVLAHSTDLTPTQQQHALPARRQRAQCPQVPLPHVPRRRRRRQLLRIPQQPLL